MTSARRARASVIFGLTVVLLLALAGCNGSGSGEAAAGPGGGGSEPPSPLASCDQLTEPPGDTAPTEPPGDTEPTEPPGDTAPTDRAAPAGESTALPALTLPCFTGGAEFALADLRGPAVVNLWASWCPPCRDELPALQRYADQHAGQVHVLGIVTRDRRSAAASLAADLGITFPALDDRDGRLLREVDTIGLPVTLYVDAAGRLAYLHQGGALDEAMLARHVAEHLGVVTP